MTSWMTHRIPHALVHALLACAIAAVAAPAAASADGLPRLDPTNGTTGTDYDFVLPVAGRPMDPSEDGFSQTFRGSFTLFQDAGSSSFDIENMTIDTDNDGQPDRTLACDGRVGRGRFGIRCSEDDAGEDVRMVITGRAVSITGSRLVLKKATGHGFTETHTFVAAFQAISN